MKRIMYFLAALLLNLSVMHSSSAAEEGQQTTAPATPQRKEQFEKSMEDRIRTLGEQLDELKAKAATMTEQVKKDMKADLNAAEKKRKIASQKMAQMRTKTESKWKKFSKEMNEAVNDFERAYEKAKSHFKE
jgi:small-conductance mechanosensitive channel